MCTGVQCIGVQVCAVHGGCGLSSSPLWVMKVLDNGEREEMCVPGYASSGVKGMGRRMETCIVWKSHLCVYKLALF